MYRFQKFDLKKKSWWAPIGSQDPPPSPDYTPKVIQAGCIICREEHQRIYTIGWMCLNKNCSAFWTVDGGQPPADLEYESVFIQQRIEGPCGLKPPYPLKTPLITAEGEGTGALPRIRVCWRGMVCPQCGCCNSRTEWNHWTCRTPGCGFTHAVAHEVVTAQLVRDIHQVNYTGHAIPMDKVHVDYITQQVRFTKHYRIHTYTLPNIGTITHFMANDHINKRKDGPDDMFVALQKVDIGMKRKELDQCASKLSSSR